MHITKKYTILYNIRITKSVIIMKKSKKIPKTHLPKFNNGGKGDATSNLYNNKRNVSLTTDQKNSIYSTLGAAGTSYAAGNNQAAYSDPNYKLNNSSKGAWQSQGGSEGVADSIQSGVSSAIPIAGLFHGISESAQSAVGTQGANAGAQYFFEPHKLITHAIDGEGLFNAKDREEHGLGKLNGGIRFAMGGMNMQPNAEIEKQENVVAPNGGFLQANGPSHDQGGVPVALPGNSMVFSDRLKLGKKTFAELNKVNNTSKEDKILESNKFGNTSKLTAELMKFAKNKNSQELFNTQEALKQAKVEAYAKKMGVNLSQSQNPNQEFPMGGVKLPMYPYGGPITPEQYKQAQTDSMNLYKSGLNPKVPNWKYHGADNTFEKSLGNLVNLNGSYPKPTNNIPYWLTGQDDKTATFQKPTMIPYREASLEDLKKVPVVNHPDYEQFIPGINKSQQKVMTEEFKYGGKKLPKYKFGVLTPEEEGEDLESVWNKSSAKIDAQHGWNSNNKVTSSVWSPEELQASSDALIEEGYTNPNSPVINTTPTANTYPIRRDKNGKLIFDTPTAPTSSVGTKRDQELYDAELARMNASGGRDSNKFDWKNTLGQVGNFAAQNAGNIYNLSRYNKPEVEKYERLKATYLDPSAALRDAEAQTRRAEYNVRGASGGNAGTYLSNRVALNAQNVINKDRIQREYQNANAGIANNIGQYNTELARQEVIANAQNRARTRSGKGEAIGSLGSNVANQMVDNKRAKMDQSMMEMLPKMMNNPEFQKFYAEWAKKNA